jgi:hypothetical protein
VRVVPKVRSWMQPCLGRTKPEKAEFHPIDPSHRFVTYGDRRARCIWLAASMAAVALLVSVLVAHPQFGEDGRYYLLSSIGQVLAAVVAFAATLPLMFAGLSDYLPFCANRLAASWHFRGFVVMFAATILFALALLCFKCAHDWLSVVALAAAAGCLCSLLPYFLWIADRTRPKNHFDDMVSIADAIALRYDKTTDTEVLAEPASEVLEHLELIGQAASVAAQRGASGVMSQALISVLMFWLKYDARRVEWAAERGEMVWGNFMRTNSVSLLAVGTAAECASRLFAKECWSGSLRPSVEVFGSVADSMPSGQSTPDSVSVVALRGQWHLGAVAQHIDANGERPRIVARCIAVAISSIDESKYPQLFGRFESRVNGWFRAFYAIDPTPELVGFRALVVEEHRELLRRLAGGPDA